ncbi:motility associated factor glycosyltransferase family protein [Novosphingobium beihaiensis]|uniref:DUF115 domain-containing protein n=1 Tax=Novosphingobium beihaiensis TaxID=2930389 RepID=A0ABT0BUI6_9SPHN|nr:hypothetical protein [Novosphingobium beihaiensis]MCJ2188720.1 hypothetical protein [Novosphingobium beihaiensis]
MKKLDVKYKFEDVVYALYNKAAGVKDFLDGDLRKKLAKNSALRGLQEGKRCFIIGNGPSIREQPLHLLRDEQTFVCNYFFKHENIREINPKYYFVIDGKLSTGEWPISMLAEIQEHCPNASLFLDGAQKHKPEAYEYDRKFGVHWVAGGRIIHPGYGFPIDLTRRIGGDNVVKIALHASIYMGFKEIYILGVDGDGLFRDLLGQSSHFYAAPPENATMDYRRMELDLWHCTEGFRSWRAIAERFDHSPVRIYNATRGGLLNIFPRRALEDVIG